MLLDWLKELVENRQRKAVSKRARDSRLLSDNSINAMLFREGIEGFRKSFPAAITDLCRRTGHEQLPLNEAILDQMTDALVTGIGQDPLATLSVSDIVERLIRAKEIAAAYAQIAPDAPGANSPTVFLNSAITSIHADMGEFGAAIQRACLEKGIVSRSVKILGRGHSKAIGE